MWPGKVGSSLPRGVGPLLDWWGDCGFAVAVSIRLSIKGGNQGCSCQAGAIITTSWTPSWWMFCKHLPMRMNRGNAYGLLFVHGWASASTASASGLGLKLKNLFSCLLCLAVHRSTLNGPHFLFRAWKISWFNIQSLWSNALHDSVSASTIFCPGCVHSYPLTMHHSQSSMARSDRVWDCIPPLWFM